MVEAFCENIDYLPFQENDTDQVIWRYKGNPIIKRNPIAKVGRIFNSAIINCQNRFVGIFRGDGLDMIPRLYLGFSDDGINFQYETNPIQFIKDGKPYDLKYAYDPRLVKIDDTYYVTWCDGFEYLPAIGLAKTTDFKTFIMLDHPFLPFNRNGVLFPKKINNQYYLLSRPSDSGHTPFGDIFISSSKDLEYWGKHKLVMRKGNDWWENLKIGPGTPPIETSIGWLEFYHGVTHTCNGYVYSIGAVILDREDPSIVKYRVKGFVMTPEEDYETNGFVPNVTFPCSALCDKKTGRIAIYYGAADTYIGLAFTKLDLIIDYILKNS